MRRFLLAVAVSALVVAVPAADEGWVIERMHIQLDIQPDGMVNVIEALDVDFLGLPDKHGIFRDIVYLQDFDRENYRRYDISLTGVTAEDGRQHQVVTSTEGALTRFRIGDPDRTVSGKETYRISYRLGGALNAFTDHDELYWNATGRWPVSVTAATITVRTPPGAIERVTCFQGLEGSTEPCRSSFEGDQAVFEATRPLTEQEGITIVTGLRKGAVSEPAPLLQSKPRALFGGSHAVPTVFEATTPLLTGMWVGFVAVIAGVSALWWRLGRDRRFVSVHYLNEDSREERVPLFGARPVAVEFEPPDRIRPGQMGLLVDQRADTLDVTATIVDLAVRGYLKITEIPKSGWFGKADWQIDRLKNADDTLLEYERIVLTGLFSSGASRKLSDLKNKFYKDLSKAKKALYVDGVERKWFRRNPNTVRVVARTVGLGIIVLGVITTFALGLRWGAGLLGLPVVAGGLLFMLMSGAMPRRTAAGREVMRRTLGFARYVRTAEKHQQDFAERANIFTAYLPYAVVFKCVDKWAQAFKDIDLQAATSGWYVGSTDGFDPGHFSSSLSNFSSSVSSTITSTPGGSGGSGFSGGGSSGGGGGGGGGGSW
jgi:uncharacterized membrane protein YgcG